jgi:hypothetical protein
MVEKCVLNIYGLSGVEMAVCVDLARLEHKRIGRSGVPDFPVFEKRNFVTGRLEESRVFTASLPFAAMDVVRGRDEVR